MRLEYELTPSDIRAFQLYHRKKGPGIFHGQVSVWMRVLLQFAAPTALIIVFFAWCIIVDSYLPLLVIPGIMIGTIWGSIVIVIYNRSALKNPRLYRRVEVILGSDGIRTNNAFCTSLYFWPSIVAVGITKNRLYIYPTADLAIIVPRRVFVNDREFDDFIDEVYAYLDADEDVRLREQSGSADSVRRDEHIRTSGSLSITKGLPPQADSESQPS